MDDTFFKQVYELVQTIPAGKVATYGQVAALVGRPRAARTVGWVLNTCPPHVPWQRVINRVGMISIENMRASKQLQADLLRAEGVAVTARDGNLWVDLIRYGWQLTT